MNKAEIDSREKFFRRGTVERSDFVGGGGREFFFLAEFVWYKENLVGRYKFS